MLTKELTTAGRVQPRFIEPMYAGAVKQLPYGAIWTYEAKLDGYRCLAANRGSSVDLWSRRGNSFKFRFPEIAEALKKLPADTLIDGEVIALDAAGRISFNALQHSSAAHLQFYAFDILLHRGRFVCTLRIERRRALLAGALAKGSYPVLRSTA